MSASFINQLTKLWAFVSLDLTVTETKVRRLPTEYLLLLLHINDFTHRITFNPYKIPAKLGLLYPFTDKNTEAQAS